MLINVFMTHDTGKSQGIPTLIVETQLSVKLPLFWARESLTVGLSNREKRSSARNGSRKRFQAQKLFGKYRFTSSHALDSDALRRSKAKIPDFHGGGATQFEAVKKMSFQEFSFLMTICTCLS
jgi:hypothetical protein